MIIQRVIAGLSILAILVSSAGVHIMHHDVKCCGHPSEVIALTDLFDHTESSCCANSMNGHESCDKDLIHDEDCCSHEVIMLKDSYFSQEIKMNFSVFSFEVEDFVCLKFLMVKFADIRVRIHYPPPLKIPSFDSQFTSSFRC